MCLSHGSWKKLYVMAIEYYLYALRKYTFPFHPSTALTHIHTHQKKEEENRKPRSNFLLLQNTPSFPSWLPSSWGSLPRWPHLLLPLLPLPPLPSLLDTGLLNQWTSLPFHPVPSPGPQWSCIILK